MHLDDHLALVDPVMAMVEIESEGIVCAVPNEEIADLTID